MIVVDITTVTCSDKRRRVAGLYWVVINWQGCWRNHLETSIPCFEVKPGTSWLRAGTVTRLRVGRCGLWIPVGKTDFTPRRPDRRRVAPNSRGVQFTTHLHPLTRCRYNSAPSMRLAGLDKNNFVCTFVFVALGRRSLQLFFSPQSWVTWLTQRRRPLLCLS
jgi:hypothetical protein